MIVNPTRATAAGHKDFLTASRREVKEETRLEMEMTALLSVASDFLRPDIDSLAIALFARPVGGVAGAGDDVDELGLLSATLRRASRERRSVSPTQGRGENLRWRVSPVMQVPRCHRFGPLRRRAP